MPKYYAVINSSNSVQEIKQLNAEMQDSSHIEIPDYDMSLLRKIYDDSIESDDIKDKFKPAPLPTIRTVTDDAFIKRLGPNLLGLIASSSNTGLMGFNLYLSKRKTVELDDPLFNDAMVLLRDENMIDDIKEAQLRADGLLSEAPASYLESVLGAQL